LPVQPACRARDRWQAIDGLAYGKRRVKHNVHKIHVDTQSLVGYGGTMTKKSELRRVVAYLEIEDDRLLTEARIKLERRLDKRLSISEVLRIIVRQHSEQAT